MIRRTLLLERNGELRLLAAIPRRWLETGKAVEMRDAVAGTQGRWI